MSSNLPFAARCAIASACLPKSDYRAKLEALHAEMLGALAAPLGECDECGTPYSFDPTDGGSICVRCMKEKLSALQRRSPAAAAPVVERVPLTDEQIEAVWKAHVLPGFGDRQKFYSPIVYAREIEAAHGITAAMKDQP